jgi:hypothetical protein
MSTDRKHTEREPFSQEIQLELKYCERCGGLWLRELGCGEVYCINCMAAMNELPAPRKLPQSTGSGLGARVPRGPILLCDLDDVDGDWDLRSAAGGL